MTLALCSFSPIVPYKVFTFARENKCVFRTRNPCRALCAADISHACVQVCPRQCRNEGNIQTLQCSPAFGLCCWKPQLYYYTGCILIKNFMLLNKEVNSSKRCFTCQCSPSSCYRQYSCLIIIHECSTQPFFLFPQMLGKWLLSPEVKGCLCKNKNPHYYLDGHYSQLFISFL